MFFFDELEGPDCPGQRAPARKYQPIVWGRIGPGALASSSILVPPWGGVGERLRGHGA